MNKNQKLILAIFIPVMIFFITLTIAYYIGVTSYTTREVGYGSITGREFPYYSTTYNHNPFDWGKTWYVWFLYLIFCFIFAYKLFADKKSNKEELKK